jgi:glutamine amidotransferase
MIVIIDYGVGNLGSVANMMKKIRAPAVVSGDPDVIARASKLILPGVGSFDGAMRSFRERGLEAHVAQRVLADRVPILGLCVGLQMFTRGSEEGQLPGLGWVPADTVRFRVDPSAQVKVPHMGWTDVTPRKTHRIWSYLDRETPRFYFVHSYHVRCDADANVLATAHHGYEFAAAIVHENIIGTQWHPEKSHSYGMHFLRAFADL